jgi:pimeloyl-ACP methyl ester carboxylesterase
MKTFILIHGAWHGAWCWERVEARLRAQGHRAISLSLTGVGDRQHLLHRDIRVETHIADVLQVVECSEAASVVLVGHSYAGMLITAVADRCADRIEHLVYVDAIVPQVGESWSSTQAENTKRQRLEAAHRDPLFAIPPPDPAVFGLQEEDYLWVKRRQTPHPAHTYIDPLEFNPRRVASLPRTFVSCISPALPTIDPTRVRLTKQSYWDGLWHGVGRYKMVELSTGHDPMISDPDGLSAILLGIE